MRRKGRYVATVIIDIDMDNNDKRYPDYRRMEHILKAGELSELIERHIKSFDAFDGICKVSVCPTYVDLYFARETAEKTCENCAYHDDFSAVCYNGDSPDRADFTAKDHACDYWSQKG